MQDQANKKRSFRQFQVYLKLQPYIQSSVAPRANHKLSYKYYGPFNIIAKVNDVAYKLQLPPQATVHPVFHVSQLRQALHPGTTASPTLPADTSDTTITIKFLQSRWRKKNGAMIEQVQVQWSEGAAIDTTWEDRQALQARFPHAEAWGQASSQGGGDVNAPDDASPPADKTRARPSRVRRGNPRFFGPEWHNQPGPTAPAT
ncbi:hypothetical protein VPH35_109656 [Triticum aestivum]